MEFVPTIVVGTTGPDWGHGGSLAQWTIIEAFVILVLTIASPRRAIVWIAAAGLLGWYSARIIPKAQSLMMQSTATNRRPLASARFEVASRSGRIVGPLLAGGLLALSGPYGTVVALMALLLAASLLWWRVPQPVFNDAATRLQWHEALSALTHQDFLRTGFIVRMLTNLAWPAFTLGIPLLVLDRWHTQSIGYGVFRSVWGISAVLGTLIVMRTRHWSRYLRPFYFLSWALTGLGFILIGLSGNYVMALLMTILASIGSPLVHVALDTEIGQSIPPDRQAHIFALQRLLMNGMNLIGLALISILLTHLKASFVLVTSGIFMVGSTVFWGAWYYRKDHTDPKILPINQSTGRH